MARQTGCQKKKQYIFTLECIFRKTGPFSNFIFPYVAYQQQQKNTLVYNLPKIASRYHQYDATGSC